MYKAITFPSLAASAARGPLAHWELGALLIRDKVSPALLLPAFAKPSRCRWCAALTFLPSTSTVPCVELGPFPHSVSRQSTR